MSSNSGLFNSKLLGLFSALSELKKKKKRQSPHARQGEVENYQVLCHCPTLSQPVLKSLAFGTFLLSQLTLLGQMGTEFPVL